MALFAKEYEILVPAGLLRDRLGNEAPLRHHQLGTQFACVLFGRFKLQKLVPSQRSAGHQLSRASVDSCGFEIVKG